ncbi:MAG: hypothetical protein K2G41_11345 [Duncaniella sp.]|uniref:hypothetical protein n=1 Tax=Duncaniella sp. TaxID=2518496 RepID=UPI0023BB69ED|nr:hypothetical protein [Duncaniella sp.]MDE6091277.1 hypothetical protein [Duncaniella sp.]
MNFNELNAHPRDPFLNFDAESHTYTLGDRTLSSVTTIVEDCFPKFDADYWAARKAPAMGLSPAELKAQWEANARHSRNLGTAMHEKIERYYLGEDAGDDGDAYTLFRHFAAAERLYPYRTEWRIYMEDYGVAGTLDFLECRPDGTFNIYDWKRSRKLIATDGTIEQTNRYGKRGFFPVGHLHDCSYYHYALQLSIYRFILENAYGIPVTHLKLGVFHPDYSMAYIVPVPYLRSEAEAVLRNYASQVAYMEKWAGSVC